MNEINNKKEKIPSPHDKFFKSVFSDTGVARDFFENYLPEPILKIVDLDDLEIQNGTHVDEELSEVFSDMLFRTTINQRDGYLYFLFEHKSYPDRLVALQLLTYMVRIWNQKVSRENNTHIPVIIPMLIYHGKTKWNIGTLKDLILDYDLLPEEAKQMIPDYYYQIYDLSQYSDEEIKGHAKLRIMFSIIRDIFKNSGEDVFQTIINAGAVLDELEERETGIQYFETCMRYILNSGLEFSREQLNAIIQELNDTYKKGSEVTMTLAEILREEGFEKGVEKGVEKGEAQAYAKIALKTLSRKFGILPVEYREKLPQLDSITLEMLNDEIESFKTIDDIKKYLEM